MEFLKLNNYWTYQLPEWDNYEKKIIEKELEKVTELTDIVYTMIPEADVWNIEYDGCMFVLINDLIYGCEICTENKEDLPCLETLIRRLPL